MVDLIFVFCSMMFFMLLCAAILQTIFKRHLVIEQRTEQYFGKTELNEKRERTTEEKDKKIKFPIFQQYWKVCVEQMSETFARKEQKKLDVLLREAGYKNISAVEFRLIQLIVAFCCGSLTILLLSAVSGQTIPAIIMATVMAFLGYRFTLVHLAKRKVKRVKQIDVEMADFFDMVNLLLEAGIGLEGALTEVCARTKGPLSDEFRQSLDDMKRGQSRREAFYSLKMRVPSSNFQSIMMSIIQADQLGVGMAKVIKNLTSRIREQKREAAREQAMKAPIKMLFPMVIFIFPAIFIVIIGPLIVKLITEGL